MSGTRFTFRANVNRGRHGWLRLTPAYSVGLVEDLVADAGPHDHVLDPFCGTGTTALACAERGIRCDSFDINPFLIWFASVKTARYDPVDLESALELAEKIERTACSGLVPKIPPMANVERWWDEDAIAELARLKAGIDAADVNAATRNLVLVGFCRVVIARSKASYRHQSVSLKSDISPKHKSTPPVPKPSSSTGLAAEVESIVRSAGSSTIDGCVRIALGDARNLALDPETGRRRYSRVITSPPYPNRMSYVRELRPYMYWMGFLDSAAAAGDLDWQAIGGTWGRATSYLSRWIPERDLPIVRAICGSTIDAIAERSPVLATYVEKYVYDAALHVESLASTLVEGARLTYVVGNSRFFDVMVDTERIYAALFAGAGLEGIDIETLRKRTSKRELFEFAVHARMPRAATATNIS